MVQEIRIEMRMRNNILYRAIFDKWPSVQVFCRKYELDAGVVGKLLNLKCSPLNKHGEFRSICKRLAAIFFMECQELFPLHLYTGQNPQVAIEVSFAELPRGTATLLQIPAPMTVEDELDRAECAQAIEDILKTLTLRQRQVLHLRFGLEDGQERTLKEVGDVLRLTPERVRQIEASGLRRLRHPVRRDILREFAGLKEDE